MTDKEAVEQLIDEKIIRGLNYCSMELSDCGHCPYRIFGLRICKANLTKDALDLINRQQEKINLLEYDFELLLQEKKAVELLAIEKFAEKLKTTFKTGCLCGRDAVERRIDNLVKKMEGDQND